MVSERECSVCCILSVLPEALRFLRFGIDFSRVSLQTTVRFYLSNGSLTGFLNTIFSSNCSLIMGDWLEDALFYAELTVT